MVAMKSLAAAASILAGALVVSGGTASAQSTSAYRSAEAVAGRQLRLGVYGNVQKDCTSGPPPAIRVTSPPKHGELNVRSGKLKAGRIARCPKLEATAQGVFYTAKGTYAGTDEVRYEVRSATGKVEGHTVTITVKDAQSPDTKPDGNAEL